jgi:hypothetical protein
LGLPVDRNADFAGHVYDALEDEGAQPLRRLEEEAPEGFEGFSELETSLSEWSFGYGVAWALARTREPFVSSRRVTELAEGAIATAWKAFGDEPWRTLLAESGARRGAEESGEPRLDNFMGSLASARSRRPREHEGQPETSGDEPA